MTESEFAQALDRLVSDAYEAGLDRETLLAVIEDMAAGRCAAVTTEAG